MDNLPIEIIQGINDQLDFFDQIYFKSSCKWHYVKIIIKQYIPNILIREHILVEYFYDNTEYVIETKYHISLKEYYKCIQELSGEVHDICVLGPHTKFSKEDFRIHYVGFTGYEDDPIGYPSDLSKSLYKLIDFKIDYGEISDKDDSDEYIPYKSFIKKCFEVVKDKI